MLQVEKISKTYHSKGIDYPVLKGITATIHDGEFVAIMGPSGSGKTTLLNVISGFISADGGKVILDGQDILTGEENELAEIRQHKLGFVFQDFMLLNGLTIRENIFLPQIIAGKQKDYMEQNTQTLLEIFGIEEIAEKYPAEVSGGQKQRASIARALSNNPSIILADEPTGNLDSKSGTAVIEAFLNAKEKMEATIFMVTHALRKHHAAEGCCDQRLTLIIFTVQSEQDKYQGTVKQMTPSVLQCLFYRHLLPGMTGHDP